MIALANDRALELTGRDYLSVSAVKQYMKCPLAYRMRYCERVPDDTMSSALAFGRSVHASVELWYRAILEAAGAPTIDDLLMEFWNEWKSCQEESEIILGKNETTQSVSDSARRIMNAFLQSEAARPNGNIVGIEEELRESLVDGAPDVLGRLDLLVELEDSFRVIDIKTSKSKWGDAQRLDAELQAVTYAQLAKSLGGQKPIQVEFVVLTKTKSPSVTVESLDTGSDAIERGNAMLASVWKAIQAEHFYPAPSIFCPSCPFRAQCSAWKG